MALISIFEEMDIRHRLVTEVLQALLHNQGTRQSFADQSQISRRHLQYILSQDRIPSPEIAQRLVRLLPLEPSQKTELIDHLAALSQSRQRARHWAAGRADGWVDLDADVLAIYELYENTAFKPDLAEAAVGLQLVGTAIPIILRRINIPERAAQFARLCIMACEVNNILNRPVSALYYAKQGRLVTERQYHEMNARTPQSIQSELINCMRNEAVALHNLNADRASLSMLDQAAEIATHASPALAAMWMPHIARDRLNAFARLPRIPLAEADSACLQGERWISKGNIPINPNLVLGMLYNALAGKYIHHNTPRSLKNAAHTLDQAFQLMDETHQGGPLHQVMLLSTRVRLFCAKNNLEEARLALDEALGVAIQAGLSHQQQQLRTDFASLLAQ